MSGRTSRSVEIPQVQRVGMICLPRREEHGQTGYQCGEDPLGTRSQGQSSRFAQACQCTVQRVDAVTGRRSAPHSLWSGALKHTRRARPIHWTALYDVLACRRRCPSWNTLEAKAYQRIELPMHGTYHSSHP